VEKKIYVSIVPGTKPEKEKRPYPEWFDCMKRARRRETRLEFEPAKEQNRLFLYDTPDVEILAASKLP